MNDWQKLKRHKLEIPPSLSETISNLQLPEVIGEKVDKRTLRKTGRTEQFATRVSKEWLEKVKGIAKKENWKLVEVLEKMLENYEKQPKVISPEKREVVQENFPNQEAIKTKPIINQALPEKSCSFFGKDDKTQTVIYLTCDKPLFDKKKRLCQSHSRQVRNKFNQFLKTQSIGSSAGWEMAWEQSSDWWHFWNLAEKEKGGE